MLRLAARGVRGEAARDPTVRYRKWGFNRSDMVDYAASDFHEDVLSAISPFEGHEAEIKAQEAPALSIVALAPIDVESDSGRELAAKLYDQSCIDMELVARFEGEWPGPALAPSVQRAPLDTSLPSALYQGLSMARGPFAAVTSGTGASLLADRAFSEKVLRRFTVAGENLDAIAFSDAGAEGRFDFRTLPVEDGPTDPVAHALVWSRDVERNLPWGLQADPAAAVSSILRQLSGAGAQIEWRHLPSLDSIDHEPDSPPSSWTKMPGDPGRIGDPHGLRDAPKPLLRGAGEYRVPRWELTPTWLPPVSTIAIRYRERIGERRLVTNGRKPTGFQVEHFLGALRSTAFQGTKKVISIEGTFRAVVREEWSAIPPEALEIGYVEEAPLPGLDVLALAVLRETGQHVLVSLPDDPFLHEVDVIDHLGFLDPFPLRPRETPSAERPLGLLGLVKALDYKSRRHRYGIDALPEGEFLAEVGALAESGLQGSIGAWIVDGYLYTERYRPPMPKPGALAAVRWVAEPAIWRGIADPSRRLKAMGGRSVTSAVSRARLGQGVPEPSGEPSAWLFESARPGLVPLFASHHPVTGDQLLTRSLQDAAQMGYVDSQLLGFMAMAAPLTGNNDHRGLPVPWARRSGVVPQT